MMKYAIISAIILISFDAYGATYYVSSTGSDTSDGSFAHPWVIPGFGSKNILGGDTLVILSGEYVMTDFYDDMITPPSGSAGGTNCDYWTGRYEAENARNRQLLWRSTIYRPRMGNDWRFSSARYFSRNRFGSDYCGFDRRPRIFPETVCGRIRHRMLRIARNNECSG